MEKFSDKDLLLNENRLKLEASDLDTLLGSLDIKLDDEILIKKLRKIRNIFAAGGSELRFSENDVSCSLDHAMKLLLADFVETKWGTGISLILQIYFNSAAFFTKSSFFEIVNCEKIMDVFSDFDSKIHNLFCALVFTEEKNGKFKIEQKPKILFLLLKYCINQHDGWLLLLLNHIYDQKPDVFVQFLDARNMLVYPEELNSLIEFISDQVTAQNYNSKIQFSQDLLKGINEFFFDLCNQLLISKKGDSESALPFGNESLLLFTIFELLASLSGRDRTGIQTEPMIVAVVGIAKRCHEIANSRQSELQARLDSDGSLPKKADFIEIMLNIWKDSIRLLGNVLDVGDSSKKRELQDLVRTLDGIPCVLGACGPNHVNQIRNWAIQTINQLCENNLENQASIEELEKLKDVSNKDVSVDRDENGKFHFKRIRHDG